MSLNIFGAFQLIKRLTFSLFNDIKLKQMGITFNSLNDSLSIRPKFPACWDINNNFDAKFYCMFNACKGTLAQHGSTQVFLILTLCL